MSFAEKYRETYRDYRQRKYLAKSHHGVKSWDVRLKPDHRLTYIQTFACGFIAKTATVTMTSPLEVVKVISQTRSEKTLKTFRRILRSQGVKGFFRGNPVGCCHLITLSSLHYYVFHEFKTLFGSDRSNGITTAANKTLLTILMGIPTVICYPFDVFRTRLVANDSNSTYKQVFRVMWKKKVLFYNGLTLLFANTIIYSLVTMTTYKQLDKYRGTPPSRLTLYESMANHFLVASLAQTVCYPIECIQRKRQLYNSSTTTTKNSTVQQVVKDTYKRHGFRGYFSGLPANVLKLCLMIAVQYPLFDMLKNLFLFKNGYTEDFLSGKPRQDVDQCLEPAELWGEND